MTCAGVKALKYCKKITVTRYSSADSISHFKLNGRPFSLLFILIVTPMAGILLVIVNVTFEQFSLIFVYLNLETRNRKLLLLGVRFEKISLIKFMNPLAQSFVGLQTCKIFNKTSRTTSAASALLFFFF